MSSMGYWDKKTPALGERRDRDPARAPPVSNPGWLSGRARGVQRLRDIVRVSSDRVLYAEN